MKKSPYPLERELGMRYYASDTPGIGGKLRSVPEDFIVEEIPIADYGCTSGPYLVCRLIKKDWEHQHAIKEIARRLGISHRRIGWAGTKDKNAVTRQMISIYNAIPGDLAAIQLKDIILEVVGQSSAALSLGDLQGNRFDIMIREAEPADLQQRVAEAVSATASALPNYYGFQRFGVIRPLTHRVGEYILKGDYENAVVTYVGEAFPHEPEDVQKIRKDFSVSHDPAPALHSLPPRMAFERAMLHHLYAHPRDYAGALQQLPPKLLSMFVSAFQSYLFNCSLSLRFEEGKTLTDAVPGDNLLFANGRTDSVTAQNITAASLHLSRGRCRIALFMPGKDLHEPRSAANQAMQEILTAKGITSQDFERASAFVHAKFEGAWRPIALKTEIEAKVEENTVRLKFILPPGHYATTVCREFMKADPLRMI